MDRVFFYLYEILQITNFVSDRHLIDYLNLDQITQDRLPNVLEALNNHHFILIQRVNSNTEIRIRKTGKLGIFADKQDDIISFVENKKHQDKILSNNKWALYITTGALVVSIISNMLQAFNII